MGKPRLLMKIKIDSKLYKRILGYSRPYFGLIALGIILASVISAMNGAIAWLVKPVLDDIFLAKNMTMLKLLPLAVVLIYLIKGLAEYAQTCIMKSVGQKIITRLRYELYEHINSMSMSFFERIPSAVLMARITNDVKNLSSVSSKVIADLARETTTLIALLVVVFWRDYKLASISILVLPLSAIPMVKIGQKLKKLSRKRQEKIAQINNLLQETFVGTKIVKAFCMEDAENAKFGRMNRQLYRLIMKSVRADEITSPLIEFLGSACLAVIIWYGGYQVIVGNTTPGTFFSFVAALFLMYKPIRKFSKMNNTVQDAMASAERVFSILDTPQDIKDHENAIELTGLKKKLEFKNLNFQYNEKDGLVLQDINVDITKGEMVALVGMSGAGKSTLANLIPRFYDATSGTILIDGTDIRKYTVASLRKNIGIVTQESILFNDSVRYNIAYGRADCSEDEIVRAAKDAYAHDFITQLPQGYDSLIGERGCRLSGGQRQRIAIARALLKNPDILILDEATSDLDTESEYYVQKALENLMQARTTLVIAHRLSTVINADKILVFDDGRLVDSGHHEELIKRDGIYKVLFERQFGKELNGTGGHQ
ncbi:MAG: lipid A export permease/ATP-binding protein MsbA [Desulfobacteraceae bacterium 4484_190.2]|nr:MAG: lipid A export permease/ATP-binding protein MsbA [Desulfobacteraceae bacterium 4484_190.2]